MLFVVGSGVDCYPAPGHQICDVERVTQKNRIGPIVLGSATLPAGSTQALLASLGIDHNSAIEASTITSLKIGKLKTLTDFSIAGVIDATGNGDDLSDTIVRLIT